jgi:hypothetical protein
LSDPAAACQDKAAFDLRADDIDGRISEKLRDEPVRGVFVHRLRRVLLLQDALSHDMM